MSAISRRERVAPTHGAEARPVRSAVEHVVLEAVSRSLTVGLVAWPGRGSRFASQPQVELVPCRRHQVVPAFI
ncbi:MAG TPA: hypothetical protein VG276_27045 [Actinomycetes bacterium]|jgi:hypothetical protein|nr:hypothetical protein [Actinomycetes bacterium]